MRDPIITTAMICRFFGVQRNTVKYWRNTGQIQWDEIDGHISYSKNAVVESLYYHPFHRANLESAALTYFEDRIIRKSLLQKLYSYPDKTYSVGQLSEVLRTSSSNIRTWINDRGLIAVKIDEDGRDNIIFASKLIKFLDENPTLNRKYRRYLPENFCSWGE